MNHYKEDNKEEYKEEKKENVRASGAKNAGAPDRRKSILKDAGVMGYELKPSDVYDLARVLDADVHEKGGELFFTYCPYCRGGESRDKNTFSVNLTSGAFKCFRSGCGNGRAFRGAGPGFSLPAGF